MSITEKEQATVAVVAETVAPIVAHAQEMLVRSPGEASNAVAFLADVKAELTKAEQARASLVKPLNDHVKMINDRFRGPRDALKTADGIVRERLLAYRREQDRLRAEQQARLERYERERQEQAEQVRRAAEASARAAREAAAREAARQEAAAADAERRRQEKLRASSSARRREIAAMSDKELQDYAVAVHGDPFGPPAAGDSFMSQDMDAAMVREELIFRQQRREAQERAAAARAAADAARQREEEARTSITEVELPVVVAKPDRLRSATGRVAERKVWRANVIDPSRVPRKYLVVDEAAIRKAVRAGARDIPGVEITQVELAVHQAR